MQRFTRTTNQVNRKVISHTMANQINKKTDVKLGVVDETFVNQNNNKQRANSKYQQKDRLGQAVVSLIFGIFGIIFFFVSWLKIHFDVTYNYTLSPGTMITSFFAYILNTVGFILGIRARRSSNGRGMAIAGITLTAFPFVIMTLVLIFMVFALLWKYNWVY